MRRLLVGSIALMAVLVSAAPALAKLRIEVRSNRADLISGGDALVAVTGAKPTRLKVRLGRRNVTSAFGGDLEGLVTGLRRGRNVLTARSGKRAARLVIRNHPLTGPIFSGPQITPWVCLPGTKGPRCKGPTTVTWMYKNAAGAFAAYDPDKPAGDVATTATGVPYVVRVETGYMDRSQYSIAVLDVPGAWNHKVMWPFGGGTNPDFRAEPVPSVLDDNALTNGFMVAINSLNVHGNNGNDVVSAEALMMLKEHIIEAYGDISWGIGEGCSGGGLQQYMIASMYPGLLDGLMPTCSFPDLWSEVAEVGDCSLLNHYFNSTSPKMWPDLTQQNAVRGKGPNPSCAIWDSTYASLLSPDDSNSFKTCGLPSSEVYNAKTNPSGTRCTVQDYAVAIWGRRASDGFAKRPYDNVGVQYGLQQLNDGRITPAQFVDLNAKIGGLDIDANPVGDRSVADPGTLRTAYRTSQVSDAAKWARVPIIDIRGHSTIEWHQDYNSYQARARLDAAGGNHDNQVIWTGETPLVADTALLCSTNAEPPQVVGPFTIPIPTAGCTANPLLAMDRWLERIHADHTGGPVAAKVVRNKPADVTDACWAAGQRIDDLATCRSLYPYYGAPRMAAGESIAGDILKCTLKPLQRSDYGVAFTDDQWSALQAAFPQGVCNWAAKGVDQQHSIPWTTFKAGPGGKPLGKAPRSHAVR